MTNTEIDGLPVMPRLVVAPMDRRAYETFRQVAQESGVSVGAVVAFYAARAAGVPVAKPQPLPEPKPRHDPEAPLIWRPMAVQGLERMARKNASPRQAPPNAPTGEQLREMREALGISQREVADRTGYSRGAVAEIERGTRRSPYSRKALADTYAQLNATLEHRKAAE